MWKLFLVIALQVGHFACQPAGNTPELTNDSSMVNSLGTLSSEGRSREEAAPGSSKRSSGSTPQQGRQIHGDDGAPLDLYMNSLYAVIHKKTQNVWQRDAPMNVWNPSHWFELRTPYRDIGDGHTYTLGSRSHERYWYVRLTKAMSGSNEYFIFGVREHPCQRADKSIYYSNSITVAMAAASTTSTTSTTFTSMLCSISDVPSNSDNMFAYQIIPASVYLKRFYNIDGRMFNFEFTAPLDEALASHRKQVSLVESHVITNCLDGQVSQTVTNTRTMVESSAIRTSESISRSSRHFNSFSVTLAFKPSVSFLGIGVSGPEYSFQTDWGSEHAEESKWETNKSVSAERSVSYEIQKKVDVPPHSCARISGYVDWVESLPLNYTATIHVRITRGGLVLEKSKAMYILEKLGFVEKHWNETEDSTLVFNTSGQLTSSFGLQSVFTALPSAPDECACPPVKAKIECDVEKVIVEESQENGCYFF